VGYWATTVDYGEEAMAAGSWEDGRRGTTQLVGGRDGEGGGVGARVEGRPVLEGGADIGWRRDLGGGVAMERTAVNEEQTANNFYVIGGMVGNFVPTLPALRIGGAPHEKLRKKLEWS
jgi:hypothetical protein